MNNQRFTLSQISTGRCLAAGHEVTALVRNPAGFPQRSITRVRVVEGDAFDPGKIIETLREADTVLSALGARSLRKEDVLERAVPQIVEAMQTMGPSRLIALGSAGALPTALDKQPAWRRWVVQNIVYNTFLKHPVALQISQYATLAGSGLAWTMVMPPMLTNGPARKYFHIDGDALPPNGSRISRADVADFMMDQLTSRRWLRRGVYVSY